MKCIISGVNIKVFTRAIHSLAKLGEELYVEPSSEGVSFHTVNSSRSAFASFVFREEFFNQYDSGILLNTTTARAGESTSRTAEMTIQSEAIKCKVAMKAFLNAFKSLASVEKNVERCKMTLDGRGAKLLLQLWCRHSVVRTYNLAFIECETVAAVFDESACIHRITSQSRLLGDVFTNFQSGQDEVSFSVTAAATTVRNYVDDEPDLSKVIRSELHLEAIEFDEYDIGPNGGEVVFCLKELRALLGFAEPVNLPITALFSQPGSPIIFSVENAPLYECKFVLATLISPSADSQATVINTAGSAVTVSRAATSTRAKSSDNNHTITHHNNSSAANASLNEDSICERLNGSLLRAGEATERSHADNFNATTPTPNRTLLDAPERPSLDSSSINTRTMNPLIKRRLSRMPVTDTGRINGIHLSKTHLSNVSNDSKAMSDLSHSFDKSKTRTSGGRSTNCVIVPSDDESDIQICGAQQSFENIVDPVMYSSPPRKKKRNNVLFRRCFNSTYDPSTMAGFEVVLAEDSDPDD